MWSRNYNNTNDHILGSEQSKIAADMVRKTSKTMPLAPPPRPPISPASVRKSSPKSFGASAAPIIGTQSDVAKKDSRKLLGNPGSPCSVVEADFGGKHDESRDLPVKSIEEPPSLLVFPPSQKPDAAPESRYEAILRDTTERFGPDHQRVGIAMHNLGMIHLNNHDFVKAEQLFARAVHVLEKSSTRSRTDVAVSMLKLAIAKKHRSLFHAAISTLHDALVIARMQHGDKSVIVADMLSHLGHIYHDMGDLQAAQDVFQDCLERYRAAKVEGIVTEMLCNIGSIELLRKDHKGAIESFTEALKRQEDCYGPCHPLVITTLDNLGYAHCKVKDYDSALKTYEKKLQSETAHFGRWNMQCCHTIMKKNLILEKLRNFSGALKGTVTALALQKQFLPLNDPSIRETHDMMRRLEIKCRRPSCEIL